MWLYFDLDSVPCRILSQEGSYQKAEMFLKGGGFSPAPLMTVLSQGIPIQKYDFDKMIQRICTQDSNE